MRHPSSNTSNAPNNPKSRPPQHPTRRWMVVAWAVLIALALTACGATGGTGQPEPDPGEPTEPVELDGPPDAPAVEGTFDVDVQLEYSADDYSEDPSLNEGGRVLRSEIEIAFDPDATVAEIQDLVDGIGGGIVSMVAGLPIVVVQVPDPGTIADLEALLDTLESDDRVLYAVKSVEVDEVKGELTSESVGAGSVGTHDVPAHVSNFGRLDHHLAVRAHAAWNAADALPAEADRSWIVIGDAFGNGTPTNGYDADFTAGDFASGNSHFHGHHVLGIITGLYPEDTSLASGRDDVTGLFPGTLDVRAVDIRGSAANTWPRRQNLLIRRIQAILDDDPSARIVVNTSLNSRSLSQQSTQALAWILRVRGADGGSLSDLADALQTEGAGLESRFVHATSAGNANFDSSGNATRWQAEDNSLFAFAALNDFSMTLPFVGTLSIPALTNTAVVEDRVNTLHAASDPSGGPDLRPLPGCADNGSIMGGTISAIGTNVFSFNVSGSTNASGTSMSTPEVAALAAWVWSLDSSLTPPEVLQLLADTALDDPTTTRSPAGLTCNPTAPQPVIDAYAATVAAGGDAVVERILDVDDDGDFDENDLASFDGERTGGTGDLAYDEFDLNGNGRAFAFAQGERFDLNQNGSFGTASRTYTNSSGFNVPIDYDETDLHDLDILCYFAWSNLYTGSTSARDSLLANACSGTPELDIVSPSSGDTFRETENSLDLEATVDPPPNQTISDYPITWTYEGDGSPVQIGQTLSGEILLADNLPCESLRIRASVDVPNLGTVTDVVTVSCILQEETFFLNVTKDAGGFVLSDGEVWVGGDDKAGEILVGDDVGDRGIQGNLQVTLGTLPDDLVQITSATLSFTVSTAVDLPATDMSELRVYQVDYGDSLEANDYITGDGMTFLPGLASTTDFTFGRKDLDVTAAVQDAWADRATRGDRVQFLLRMFPAMTNNDGVANQLQIAYEDRPGTYLLPALEITFQNY